jgi:hypothetical protein
MKRLCLIAYFVCCTNLLFAQKGKEKVSMAYKNMSALVSHGNFSFEADSATPVSGHSISMATNSNHLKFKNDSIEGYLPYFGKVTSGVAYTNDGAIILNSKPLKYKVRFNEGKRRITITFNALEKSGLYVGILEITASGYANLRMTTVNRTSMRYYGRIYALEH